MRKRIARLWRNRPRPFTALWKWATTPKDPNRRARRWKALVEWTKAKREQARHDHRIARAKWWAKKRTIYRRKLKQARKRAEETGRGKYEPWMANGYDDNVVQGVKDFIARGVVLYDLTCTSLRRTYVPPGGSSTSYHLRTPGQAGDIAGARMVNFQVAEYDRGLGNPNYLELFGPSNSLWIKYGADTGGAEGTALEQLHDTHVHGAFAR